MTAKTTKTTTQKDQSLTIEAPKILTAQFKIRGIAPYVQNKFPEKARQLMRETQEAGSQSKKGKKKEGKNFNECYEQSMHKSVDGWFGIPASAFRNAMISACRVCGFQMTKAKLAVFVDADGFDAGDGTPLVKITKGKPHYVEHYVRIQQTTDIRARAMWDPGWEAMVTTKFDGDMFSIRDVANLLIRVGLQVGIGEGRPDSKTSGGMGWGLFEVISE